MTELHESTRNMVLSYLDIRRAIGWVGLSLPILLGPTGWAVYGLGIQENMSSYYHTPMRDVFVGVMCTIGVFLFCYRGTNRLEQWTGYLSSMSTFVIALCPIDAHTDPLHQRTIAGHLHTVAGGTFFITLAVYPLFHFPQRKSLLLTNADEQPSEIDRIARNAVYYLSGFTILAALGAMGAHFFLLSQHWYTMLNSYGFTFWMEWIAVWAFSAAWLTKGRAIVADIAEPLAKLQQMVRR